MYLYWSSLGPKGWKLYNLDTQEVFISRDVIFSKENFAGFESNNEDQPVVPLLFEEANAVNLIFVQAIAQQYPIPPIGSDTIELSEEPNSLQSQLEPSPEMQDPS